MNLGRLASWIVSAVICASGTALGFLPTAHAATPTGLSTTMLGPDTPNNVCLGCHALDNFSGVGPDGKPRLVHVTKTRFENSVHGKRRCVECHVDISEVPHKLNGDVRVNCVDCHRSLWRKAQSEGTTQQNARLGVVVEQIDHFMDSVHARPRKGDASRVNAICYDCHDPHYVYPKGSTGRAEWRRNLPYTCGSCHPKERDEYLTSVHGVETVVKGNPNAAVCSDCHTTHQVANPALDSTKLVITKNCGTCHDDKLKTYTGTYHGQVNQLGFAYTAKCFDCHGSHGIQRATDSHSKVHPDNLLGTCQQCHEGATEGFASFQPHGDPDDFDRYPFLWITKKFMDALLIGVFAFFWTHVALWFYRENKERKQQKQRPHVKTDDLNLSQGKKYFKRFPIGWRIAHLILLLSVMTLTLTGMSALFSGTAWAPVVMETLGSPKVAAIMHRVAASLFIGVFLAHLAFVVYRIVRAGDSFKWFGASSMVPNLKDGKDVIAMFKWFFGKGERPIFDRWTYWEKFDYWAVFWGMGVIGGSGLMLWAPTVTAQYLPGWVFNIATIFHGEEAILASVFLFTVHFFNNHFRPEKFPLDTVMFTGVWPIDEFRHEHTVEYNRLVESGELSKYLVDAPSRPMALGSRILGFTLLSIGLTLLILVFIGLFGGH